MKFGFICPPDEIESDQRQVAGLVKNQKPGHFDITYFFDAKESNLG